MRPILIGDFSGPEKKHFVSNTFELEAKKLVSST